MHPSARYTLVVALYPAIPHCPAVERLFYFVARLQLLVARSHAEANQKNRGSLTSERNDVPHVRCNFASANSLLQVLS